MIERSHDDRGILLISLDFELHWGVHDTLEADDYRENLLGVRRAVPALLDLFGEYGIHATWATVGFLFFERRDDLIRGLPDEKPSYTDGRLSPYSLVQTLGRDEGEDPLHYAGSLIEVIRSHPHQEIGSHTFSHYYCLEEGQTGESFRADLRAAMAAARGRGITLESFVFPKNQLNPNYVGICREMGIKALRGNAPGWMYRPKASLAGKVARLLDAHANLSGHNCYPVSSIERTPPFNMPASQFLRPHSRRLRVFERLKLRRIRSDLTYAARKKQVYHLWWHPHNFGSHIAQNLAFLRRILNHYAYLRDRFRMRSLNMGELSRLLATPEAEAASAPEGKR